MRKGKFSFATLALAGLAAVSASAFAGGSDAEIMGYSTQSHWARLSGHLDMDQVFFGGDNRERVGYPSGANLRRARLDFRGGLNDQFVYRFEGEFAGTPAAGAADERYATELYRAYLGYNGFSNVHLRLGQDTPVYTMGYGSDDNKHMTFVEFALPVAAFAPDQALGLWVETHINNFGIQASVFEERDGKAASTGSQAASDNVGVSGRVYYSPVHNNDYALHFGLTGLYQNLHDNHNSLAFRTVPEALAKSTATYSTALTANSAKDYTVLGLEAAMVYGPWYVGAEYLHNHVDQNTVVAPLGDSSLKGYYVEGSYMLTGESRQYSFKNGRVGGVEPAGRHGALELAARFSYLDLADNNSGVGKEHNFSLGANWVYNHHVTFTGDYIHARLKQVTGVADRNLDIVALRAHVTF